MGEGLKVRVEVDHFFEWLQEFEQRVQGLGGGGCSYNSATLQTRVQYSWYQAATAGRPAICFSDLHIPESADGRAIVQAVAACFFYGHHALEAETLIVEHPSSASMCEWLAASAFNPVLAPGEITPSWYLSRGALLPETEDQLAIAARTLPAVSSDDADASGTRLVREQLKGTIGAKKWSERKHS